MNTVMTFGELRRRGQAHPAYAEEGQILAITEAVCLRMQELHLSKAALARRLGTSAPYVTKLLNGRDNFTIATLTRLGQALECQLAICFTPSPSAVVPPPPVQEKVRAARSVVAQRRVRKAAITA